MSVVNATGIIVGKRFTQNYIINSNVDYQTYDTRTNKLVTLIGFVNKRVIRSMGKNKKQNKHKNKNKNKNTPTNKLKKMPPPTPKQIKQD